MQSHPDCVEGARLSANERDQLRTCEAYIANGIKAFLDMGKALAVVRDYRLYRERFPNFHCYLRDVWDLSRPRAYQLISARGVFDELSTMVDKAVALPENERQLRILSKVSDPNDRVAIWKRALMKSDEEGVPVSSELVRLVLIDHQASEQADHKRDNNPAVLRCRGAANSASSSEEDGPAIDHKHLSCLIDGIEEGLHDKDIKKVRIIVKKIRAILNRQRS